MSEPIIIRQWPRTEAIEIAARSAIDAFINDNRPKLIGALLGLALALDRPVAEQAEGGQG